MLFENLRIKRRKKCLEYIKAVYDFDSPIVDAIDNLESDILKRLSKIAKKIIKKCNDHDRPIFIAWMKIYINDPKKIIGIGIYGLDDMEGGLQSYAGSITKDIINQIRHELPEYLSFYYVTVEQRAFDLLLMNAYQNQIEEEYIGKQLKNNILADLPKYTFRSSHEYSSGADQAMLSG